MYVDSMLFDADDRQAQPGDPRYEARRRKALQVIYELKFTFGMEELAREFLQRYVADTPYRGPALDDELVTERVLRRVA